jgi:hypothetical protein
LKGLSRQSVSQIKIAFIYHQRKIGNCCLFPKYKIAKELGKTIGSNRVLTKRRKEEKKRKFFNQKVEKLLTNKNMNMNQKGFANIALIVVIIILVGAVGYFAFVKKSEPVTQQPATTQTTTAPTTQASPAPQGETSNWKVYRNDKYGFEFINTPASFI